MDAALREVRLALLEADVNYKIVKNFVSLLKERALGAEVLKSLTPGQQVVKIVYEELVNLMGETRSRLDNPPRAVMLVGLQGSGKTTTAVNWPLRLKNGQAHAGSCGCLLSGSDPATEKRGGVRYSVLAWVRTLLNRAASLKEAGWGGNDCYSGYCRAVAYR